MDHPAAFSSHGFFFSYGSAEETAFLAELRNRSGDAAVARFLRSRELVRHPRPLDESERAVADAALAPVLADLRAGGASGGSAMTEPAHPGGPVGYFWT